MKAVVRNHPEGLRLACTAGQTTDARNTARAAQLRREPSTAKIAELDG
ncbi:hypothetical protein QFZ22_006039 [Streptomyces canus]|uniref:Uncharacterized protein n=1 Tax=Streptomyces canus TaxID=58343 RepID=A0AAW8FJ59_9ACTN|nr:hypothetical protein [Streptomyces canus]